MQKMYYLFSQHKNLREAICVCENDDSVATPLFQTGVYPVGTLLSKAIQIINPWINNSNFPLGKDNLLEKGFKDFVSSADFSFSSMASSDPNVKKALNLLLKSRWNLPSKREEREIYNLLKKYMSYIHQCQKDKNNSLNSSQYLNIIVSQQKDTLPKHFVYLPDPSDEYRNNINAWINIVSERPYVPNLKHFSQIGLFHLQEEYPAISTTEWGSLYCPLDVYEIFDMVDLLLASLTCIFEHHYHVKECPYCKSLFVTHRANQVYCPAQSSKDRPKTCQRKMNELRQNARNKFGIPKKEHNLSTMFGNKYGTSPEEDTYYLYNNFKNDCRDWKRKITSGEATEKEYSDWLESKYVYKYKKKNKRTVS